MISMNPVPECSVKEAVAFGNGLEAVPRGPV